MLFAQDSSRLLVLADLAQVDLVDSFLDQAQLVFSGQALARHLLGGGDGEIGHLFPDLLERLGGVALDLLAGLGQSGLGLDSRLLQDLRFAGLAQLARPLQDGLGLLPGLGQLVLVVGQQLLGFVAQLLGARRWTDGSRPAAPSASRIAG